MKYLFARGERAGLAGKARSADPPRLDNYMTNSNSVNQKNQFKLNNHLNEIITWDIEVK